MSDLIATGKGSRSAHAREARRERILDAFLEIVLDESRQPVADEVAERAGVSRATLFRYFESLPELHSAVRQRILARFPDLFALPPAHPDLDDSIDAYVDSRTTLYETLQPVFELEQVQNAQDPSIAEFLSTRHRFFARQASDYFEAHLAELDPTQREDVLAAISILTSFESWDQLRRIPQISTEATNIRWRRVVRLLFRGA